MKPAFLTLVLALGWTGITGSFAGANLLLGLAIGGLAVWLLREHLAAPAALRKLRAAAGLALFFAWELLKSAVRVALVVIRPDIGAAVRPAIVAVPLTLESDAGIALLANMITLTPGTLSIDVAADRSVLYVHVLEFAGKEALLADIAGGFERRVKELLP